MTPLIVPGLNPSDKEFQHLIESPYLDEERRFLERLWEEYEPYADKQFRIEIASNFHRRFWEMYLTCALMENGFEPSPKTYQKGPDVCAKVNNRWTWFEAIAPSGGEGPDAIFKPELDVGQIEWFMIPEEKIILRYIAAVIVKSNGYMAYLNDGVVRSGDPYVIALNGRRVPYSNLDDDTPYIVKVLLYEGEIRKANDSLVSTGIFYDKEYTGISGVLFSNSDLKNRPLRSGSEFIFVHNPLADNPIQKGWFSMGSEYWKDDNLIHKKDYGRDRA